MRLELLVDQNRDLDGVFCVVVWKLGEVEVVWKNLASPGQGLEVGRNAGLLVDLLLDEGCGELFSVEKRDREQFFAEMIDRA